jgi:hypothetical protein
LIQKENEIFSNRIGIFQNYVYFGNFSGAEIRVLAFNGTNLIETGTSILITLFAGTFTVTPSGKLFVGGVDLVQRYDLISNPEAPSLEYEILGIVGISDNKFEGVET